MAGRDAERLQTVAEETGGFALTVKATDALPVESEPMPEEVKQRIRLTGMEP